MAVGGVVVGVHGWGHAWLWEVCMVAGGCVWLRGGVHGCGGHAWLWGACVVAGGMHGCGGGTCMVVGGMHGCRGYVW